MVYCPQNYGLCLTMQKLSQEIWIDSGDAIDLSYPLYEETISQTTSLKLNRAHRPDSGMMKAPNEQKNGADWLWFIHDDISLEYIVLAVQAKRLDEKGRYKAFDLSQPSKLNRFAHKNKYIPLYIFYNHSKIGTLSYNQLYNDLLKNIFLGNFYSQDHRMPNIPCDLGATYIYAPIVQSLAKNFKNVALDNQLKRLQRSWWKIACRCGQVDRFQPLKSLAERLQSTAGLPTEVSDDDFPNKVTVVTEPKAPIMNWFLGKTFEEEQLWESLEISGADLELFAPDYLLRTRLNSGGLDD